MACAFAGSRTLPARCDTVWAALNDVDWLRRCIPGCTALSQVSPTRYELTILVQLGPLRVPFDGAVEVVAADPPSELTLRGLGDGGLLGDAVGVTRIRLAESGPLCRAHYDVDVTVSGLLSALGMPFIIGHARSLTEQFVESLANSLDGASSPCTMSNNAPPQRRSGATMSSSV